MTLPTQEFMRRFLQHVLLKGLHRVQTGQLRLYRRLTAEECAAFAAQEAAVTTTATARAPPLSNWRGRCAQMR